MTSLAFSNPFENLSYEDVYQGLMTGRFGPRWPAEDLQKGYTGTNKIDLVRRAFTFVEMLAQDGAFVHDWKGLDYGCGWGRFASVLLSKGSPEQLDLCDAWDVTLSHLSKLNYKNTAYKVPSLLVPNSIPTKTYDFVLSFSVFTHLSPKSFEMNIPVIKASLKKGGKFYFTVRHAEFFDHKYPNQAKDLASQLAKDGVVFIDSGGDQNKEKLFGDTVVTKGYLEQFGKLRYLGLPHSLQHVYVIDAE